MRPDFLIDHHFSANSELAPNDQVLSSLRFSKRHIRAVVQQREQVVSLRKTVILAEVNNRDKRRELASQSRRLKGSVVTIPDTIRLSEDQIWASSLLNEQDIFEAPTVLLKDEGNENGEPSPLKANVIVLWRSVREALFEWSQLREGWDGEAAQEINSDVLEAAKSFINAAERYGISEPEPYINSDGDIGLIWEQRGSASVSFSPTDRFTALCPRKGKLDLRIAGPLDIAVCSPSLFESIRDLHFDDLDRAE